MATESQIVVKLFCEKNNLKLNKKDFSRQLGIANNLLKEYTLEEIVTLINYLCIFPLKKEIHSLGYYPYIIEEELPKAKHYFYMLNHKDEPIKEIKVEVKNEPIVKKSMFSKNRRF